MFYNINYLSVSIEFNVFFFLIELSYKIFVDLYLIFLYIISEFCIIKSNFHLIKIHMICVFDNKQNYFQYIFVIPNPALRNLPTFNKILYFVHSTHCFLYFYSKTSLSVSLYDILYISPSSYETRINLTIKQALFDIRVSEFFYNFEVPLKN